MPRTKKSHINTSRAHESPSPLPPQYGSTHTCSDFSPQYRHRTPQSTMLPEPKQESLDFTQRIERKLAQYNASQNVFKRWLFEMGCWLTSALCMVAIIVIYARIRDQPLLKSGSALTWVNVLGKIASAALIVPTSEALGQLKWNWFHESKAMWDFEIFDKASRGPLGALMLLYRTKGRSLAAMGALLILLLLAIDTFFQQVTDLPERLALQSTASAVPRTVRYAPSLDKVWREGVLQAVDDDDVFLLVNKYSYRNGTQSVPFGNGTRPDIPVSCPTSNCTWPVYETLGVCSECADISSYLNYTCLTSRVDWTVNQNGGYGIEGGYPNATMCGYFLNATSEHPILMSGYLLGSENGSKGDALIMRTLPLTAPLSKIRHYGDGSIHFKHLRHVIIDALIVSSANGSAAGAYRGAPPAALECVLSWCVKTLRSTYDEGRYHEEIIGTFFNTTTSPSPDPWTSEYYETDAENGTDITYLPDIDIYVEKTLNENKTTIFGMSNDTAAVVIQSFIDIFPAQTSATNESTVPLLRYRTWQIGPPYMRELDFNPWVAPNNVTRHMERLATALTNEIRSVKSNATFVPGSAYGREVFIYVKWEWLSFPLLLLLLSLAFLISTMVKTSKDGGMGIWKNSAMPTLIYSLPKEIQPQFHSSSSSSSSTTWNSTQGTKKVRIRLLPNMGWRVSGTSQMVTSPRVHPVSQAPRGWI
ncbi:Nn.00g044100.m01.CDS01 [Neocucurbitaria sp. VM-36]